MSLFKSKSGLARNPTTDKTLLKALIPDIINKLNNENLMYEIHHFYSGAVMVDIYIKEKFSVIQIYGNGIGFSLINEDTS